MKKLKIFASVTALLAAIAFHADAHAVDRSEKLTLSPFVGGYVFEGNQNLRHSPVYGVGAGYNFGRNWGGEASFGFIDSSSTAGDGDVDGYLIQINGLYHFMPDNRLQPYLTLGSGAVILDSEKGGSSARFLVNAGGGVEYFITDNLALHGDARYILALGTTNNNFMYYGGLTLYFNSRPRVKEAEAAPSPPAPEEKAEAPAPPPPPPAPAPKKQEAVCILLKVEFDFDKDNVKPEYHDDIKRVADFLKDNPTFKGTIEGGTDAVGSEEYNLDLSMRRAESVKKHLVDNFGIDPARLETVGFGKSEPVATNLTEEGRQRNRRAVRVYCSSGEDVPPPMEAQKCIVLKVEFALGSSEVDPKYNDNFKEMADYMKGHPAYVGTIEGYADATGSDKLNMELSVKRAESVKKHLVDNYGIPAGRLNTVGIGSRMPISSNATPEGRAANRYAVQVICEPE